METVVREAYESATGVPLNFPPTSEELESPLFTTLDASSRVITDLGGLEACTSLTDLNLAHNDVTDLSPLASLTGLVNLRLAFNAIDDIDDLSGLTNLVSLDLGFGDITSEGDAFDPGAADTNLLDDTDLNQLAGLTNLEYLNLGGNTAITSLAVLTNFSSLNELWLGSSTIADWSPVGAATTLTTFFEFACGFTDVDMGNLASLPGLTNLYLIFEGGVTDISPLAGLDITTAYFDFCAISDISTVASWTNLMSLSMSSNQVQNLDALVGLVSLETALFGQNQISEIFSAGAPPITGLANLMTLFLDTNLLTNLDGVEFLPGLTQASFAENQITDISALGDGTALPNLIFLLLGGNQIVDISLLTGATGLIGLDLFGNQITDLQPLLDNTGLGDGDFVNVSGNPLTEDVVCNQIPALEAQLAPTGVLLYDQVCIPATLTVLPVEGTGTCTPAPGDYTHSPGDVVGLFATIVPNSGFAFLQWEDGGGNVLATTEYTEITITGDMAVKAVFVPGDHTLTFGFDAGNTGTGNVYPFGMAAGAYSYMSGRLVLLNAVPDPGNFFGGWTDDAASFGLNPNIAILMDGNKTVNAIFTNTGWTLTLGVIGTGGTNPPPGSYSVADGVTLDLSAFVTDAAWPFLRWEDGDGNPVDSAPSLSVLMDADKTVNAVFTQIQLWTLTMAVDGQGTTSPPEGSHVYLDGTPVFVSATPATGWLFDHWSGDLGGADPAEFAISVTMDMDRTLTAVFVEADFTLTLDATGPGSIIPVAGTYYYRAGDRVVLTAIPDPGEAFIGWKDEGGNVVAEAQFFELTMNQNWVITAEFSAADFTLTVETAGAGLGDTVPVPGLYGYLSGMTQLLTATPAADNFFGGWYVEVEPGKDKVFEFQTFNYNYTITMDANKTASAQFEPTGYTLTIAKEGEGTTDLPEGSFRLIENANLTLTATTALPWVFVGWKDEGDVIVSTSAAYEITLTQDTALTAVFEIPVVRTLQISVTGQGTTVPGAGAHFYADGAPVTIDALPAAGWLFSHWDGDIGAADPNVTPLDVVMDMDRNITAVFVEVTWDLQLSVMGQGSTVPQEGVVHTYVDGTDVLIEAVPAAGWAFSVWEGDIGAADPSVTPLTVTMDMDRNITAVFVEVTWDLQVSVTGQGTTVPAAGIAHTYSDGAPVQIDALPETGWLFSRWEGDIGAANPNATPLNVVMDMDRNITAVFVEEGGELGPHSADQDANNMINLTELLRVIQFFNIRGFHCAIPPDSTEDGYVPGAGGDQSCAPHSSDYAPQNWQISLTELLRLIQFFNIGGYHACPEQMTEDGYCPGL
jgi:Leucine-rich repeat (LRR) protein